MRLVMYRRDGGPGGPGLIDGDTVVPLSEPSLQDILRGGRAALERVREDVARATSRVPIDRVRLEPPLRPATVVAPGPGVHERDRERLEEHREFYLKSAHTVIGPERAVPYREALGRLSYRGQLGLVLDRTARHTDEDHVLDGLLGAVVAAEVYSSDLLRVGWEGTMWHVRYGEGASFDGACPIGAWFVTADELDLGDLVLEDAAGSAKVEPEEVAAFAAYVARWMALDPSTLVLAGSSHGPLLAVDERDPVIRWPDGEPALGDGDRVVVRCDGLGELDAPVTAGER